MCLWIKSVGDGEEVISGRSCWSCGMTGADSLALCGFH